MRLPVFDRRRAGVLLPMSALDAALGRGGRAFIDWLSDAAFSVWQILPAGPVGEDRSPYWVRSDCAGNAAFIDAAELPDPNAPIDPEFLAASSPWLHDYALFEALTRAHAGAPFWNWPPPLRDRAPEALAQAAHELAPEVARIEREQYAFHVQWNQLRAHARSRGVRLFGDLPFYVGPSSVETWAHRELFQLTATGEPAAVGGVPPDYFSQLGQLWGNPIYDWQALQNGFGLPGMRVLQFAFDGDPANAHLPYLHERDCVAYTGTHDNDTTLGWYASLDRDTAQRVDYFLRVTEGAMPAALIRAALGSVARLAIIPAQDILGLDSFARLNTPGTVEGNWTWRLPAGALTAQLARDYARLNGAFGRAPG